MSDSLPSFIVNHEAVVSAFGCWPSFHDALLLSFAIHNECVELRLQGWILTNDVDESGFFVLTHHHEVTLRFEGVTDAQLEGLHLCEAEFGRNILSHLDFKRIEPASGVFEVHLESVVDPRFDAHFRAAGGRVVSVIPCAAPKN